MTISIKKSCLIGIAVLGLVAGLLGGDYDRAEATAGEPDNLAEFSACVGPAAADAGFEDTAGTALEDAVNCLAYYGITQGRDGDRFAPGETVLRWQMALFLARAARPAGIVLPSSPSDQGFTDLDELSPATRDDINRVAQLGIMPGLYQGHFEPNRAVTRESMAVLLDAFLSQAMISDGGFRPADVKPDDAVFTDIGGASINSYNAIRRVYELGITRGVGGGRFAPNDPVTRGQMAAFITRTLGHTIARPAGVTVQVKSTGSDPVTVTVNDGVQLSIAVRDSAFSPLPNAPVDVFTFSGTAPVFTDEGSCLTNRVRAVGGTQACAIDFTDERTNLQGVLALSITADRTLTVRAWSGQAGDQYDSDQTVGAGSLDVTTFKEASQLLISDDLAEGQKKLHFGDAVTFTVQVADEDENPIPEADKVITIGENITAADGSASGRSRTFRTDAAGAAQFSFIQNDPDAAQNSPDAVVAFTVGSADFSVNDKTANGTDANGRYTATWSDDAPVETTLALDQEKDYTLATDDGKGAVHTVTALLTDQYGDPIPRGLIHFTSNDPAGLGMTASGGARYQRFTDDAGMAFTGYRRDNAAGRVETITALYQGASAAADDDISAERLYHYWAVEPEPSARFTARLVQPDLENNRLLLLGNDVWLVSFDGNDQLSLASGPAQMDAFVRALEGDQVAHAAVSHYADRARGVSIIALRNRWPKLAVPAGAEHDEHAFVFASDDGVIVVGSPKDDVTSGGMVRQEAGAVYVYEGADDDSPARLTSSTPVGLGGFGSSVDIRGDVIAVGHPRGGSTGKGIVEVFTKPAGGWADSDSSTVWHDGSNGVGPSATNNYEFGKVVTLSGDGTKMAVAAPGRTRVYLFTISGADADDQTGMGVPVLVPSDASAFTGLLQRAFAQGGPGGMLAVSEDGSTVAVGAYALPSAEDRDGAGAVYMFVKPDPDWNDTAANQSNGKLTEAGALSGEWLGWSVDITADGSTVVTGAHATDAAESRALIYQRPAGGWGDADQPTAALSAPSGDPLGEEDDDYGQHAAISDDGSLVASSRAARPAENDHLREPVHIFTRPAEGWTAMAPDSIQHLAPRRWIRFGWGTTIDDETGQVLSAEAVVPHQIYLITP